MSLSTLLDQLKKTLSNAQTERTYSQARSRHRALQPYESIGALVAVTARGSSIFAIDREAILAGSSRSFSSLRRDSGSRFSWWRSPRC